MYTIECRNCLSLSERVITARDCMSCPFHKDGSQVLFFENVNLIPFLKKRKEKSKKKYHEEIC